MGKTLQEQYYILYSQITGAFQLSANTPQGLRKDRDWKIQNYLSDWGMGLSQALLGSNTARADG